MPYSFLCILTNAFCLTVNFNSFITFFYTVNPFYLYVFMKFLGSVVSKEVEVVEKFKRFPVYSPFWKCYIQNNVLKIKKIKAKS